MRKFYSCSVGEENKGYDEENLNRIIDEKAFILHENAPQKGEYHNIKKDDILLLKYRSNFIAYGEALDIKKSTDEEWNLLAPVKNWCFYDKLNSSLGTHIYGMKEATLRGSQYGTVKPLESSFSINKMSEIDNDTHLYNTLKSEFRKIQEIKEMQDKIDVLKYKKQIILQGPPGTGKTRMAKMLAHELTKSKVKLSPYEYVEWYIKNYKSSKKSKDRNAYLNNLLNEFTEEFSLDKIKNISLDEYCLGKGSTTSFCYWIERGLKDLGGFSPGPGGTTVYGVYFSREDNEFKSNQKTPDELIKDIRIALTELIEKEDYSKARDVLKFRYSFILKILNSYFPDKYFPIVSQDHLKSIASILKINTKGLNDVEINKKINEFYLNLKKEHSSQISSIDLMGHLYNKFKIKKNEFNEVQIDVIEELGDTKLIQFHPAYSYEDFVRGIVVEANQNNQIEYKVVNKILADLAQNALENPAMNYVLIIDEINRANLPSVLGELIYALEYRYDDVKKNIREASIESMYALKQNENDVEGDNTLLLPTNLYIIGTMNTADRSVGHIDYAIRRRFAFIDIEPDSDIITYDKAKELFNKVGQLFTETYLASDFDAKEVQIGHSYFLLNDDSDFSESEQLKLKLDYEILPILNEYVKDGLLLENAKEKIKEISEFEC